MCLDALVNFCFPCQSNRQVSTVLEIDKPSKKIVDAFEERRPFLLPAQATAAASALSIKTTENRQKIESYIQSYIQRCKEANISYKNSTHLRQCLEDFYLNPNTQITLDYINKLKDQYFIESYIQDCEVKKIKIDQIDDIEDLLKINTDIKTINQLRDYFVAVNELLEKFKSKTCMLPVTFHLDLQEKINDRINLIKIQRFIKSEITQFELKQAFQVVKEVYSPKKEKELTIYDFVFSGEELLLNDPGIEIYEIEDGKEVLKERSIRSCSFK